MFRGVLLLFGLISTSSSAQFIMEIPEEDWATVPSTSFFSRPTTLLEHREVPGLRGVLSVRSVAPKKNQEFNALEKIKAFCVNIPKSYEGSKRTKSVRAKVVSGVLPYCRVQVNEGQGLLIDQLLFVSLSPEKRQLTHTLTFFYPTEEEKRSSREVTKLLNYLGRRQKK
jgi:hypothetical protein